MVAIVVNVGSVKRRERSESLEAIVVFFAPLLFVVPLYLLDFLAEVPAAYATFGFYIVCSIMLTKYRRRSLAEIGLTRKGFFPSFGYSGIIVVGAFLSRFVFGELALSPDITPLVVAERGLYNFVFSGFGQEILFRGLILFSFLRWKGWRAALLISSVLFGLVHVYSGLGGMIATSAVGAYWGWVALKTRNIVGIALIHGSFNFLFDFLMM